MFVRGVSNKVYWLEGVHTAQDALIALSSKEQIPSAVVLLRNGKYLHETETQLDGDEQITVLPAGGLPGGKGGFGSMLRSIGAQIERTTNHEAMRDLSGRRQRDVNNERRLKDYIAGQADRERENEEKKEKKLEKLRRIANGENKCKHDFSDPSYDKARSETEEKIHDAVEAAMGAIASTSRSDNELKRKVESKDKGPAPKKKGLWIGDGLEDLDDSDLTDSDDDSDEGQSKSKDDNKIATAS